MVQASFTSTYFKRHLYKFHPTAGHDDPEGEWRYSFTLSLTSALDVVDGQRHVPGALPPGKTQYLLYRRLGGSQGRSGRMRIISPPTRIRSPDRPARNVSLHRLSYSQNGTFIFKVTKKPLQFLYACAKFPFSRREGLCLGQ